MYLLTQSKKTLTEFDRLEISRNLGGKKEQKYLLVAWKRTASVIIGYYPDEEVALAEIRRIADALCTGQAVYEVL